MDSLRISHRPQHVDCTLMHVCGHAGDVIGFEIVVLHHLEQRIRRRMRMAARRMKLERSLNQTPARAEAIDQLCRISVARHARGHALLAFQYAMRTGEAVARDVRCHQPVGRGLGRMQLLGICRVTQKFPQPRRHGARRTDAMLCGARIELEQMGDTRRCRQFARSAGGVEHLVMRTPEKLADAHAALVTGHRCRDQILARGADFLRSGQHRRKHHSRRVIHRAIVHIILLHHVRRRAVDQRCKKWRGAPARGQNL